MTSLVEPAAVVSLPVVGPEKEVAVMVLMKVIGLGTVSIY